MVGTISRRGQIGVMMARGGKSRSERLTTHRSRRNVGTGHQWKTKGNTISKGNEIPELFLESVLITPLQKRKQNDWQKMRIPSNPGMKNPHGGIKPIATDVSTVTRVRQPVSSKKLYPSITSTKLWEGEVNERVSKAPEMVPIREIGRIGLERRMKSQGSNVGQVRNNVRQTL
ncbi:hypothetical protein JV46_01120 [Solemya velum gill symbiont]|uniref:Uncharacterized protein n=1 Tax=Solemya velum gill symbiont TaxID=2340 RepID=A0A0B0H4E9_SOVGS|nr:hypothetical protein JV46_01120 [Solemya velum gill symbiont]OOZ09972.1 hypothetical protein BOW25_13335 [Solemya velum gill symbiont]